MIRRALAALLSLAVFAPLLAQQVGDSANAVLNQLGNPQMKRQTGDAEVWYYPGGARITFANGHVSAIAGNPHAEVRPPPAQNDYVTRSAPEPNRSSSSASPSARWDGTGDSTGWDNRTVNFPLPPEVRRRGIYVLVGILVSLICNILILIKAFKESVWWGLGYLFVPFVSLIFVILHWARTWKPFVISAIATVVIVVQAYLIAEAMRLNPPH
jgi:hypothetical protein